MNGKHTKVINIVGGPGVGKTTIAALLFSKIKELGYDVENVSEFAKELTWEGRKEAFNDRLYMHAEQNHRLMQMNGKLNYIITDSPLFLTAIYNDYYLKDLFFSSYNKMINNVVKETFNYYDNYVYLLERNTKYHRVGRRETKKAALDIDAKIKKYLKENNIKYKTISISNKDNGINLILNDLGIKAIKK